MEDLSCFLQHGAKLDSFGYNPVRCLNSRAYQQIKLLHSVGFSDWKSVRSSLLDASVRINDTAETLFALECLKVEPNELHPAIDIALLDNDIYNSSILIEYGADINYSTTVKDSFPWTWNLNQPCIEVPHWLLFRSNTDLKRRNSYSLHKWYDFVWDRFWIRLPGKNVDALPFVQMESVLSHFLLYGSDPHKIFGVGGYITLSLRPRWDGRWFGCSGQLRAMEIARFWASWVREGCKEIESQDQIERPSAPELRANYEEEEIQRIPRLASWSSDGTVFYTRPPAYPINRSVDPPRPLPPLLKKTRDAFQRTSLFYEMIATPEGRSHLSRFPHGKKISLFILFPS